MIIQVRQLSENINIYQVFLMGQLSALFYKNWLLYKRAVLGNILQILIPIFFIAFVVMVRKLDPVDNYTQQSFIGSTTYAKSIDSISSASAYLKKCSTGSVVALSPSTDPLITRLSTMLTGLGYTPKSFTSDSALDLYVKDANYQTFTQKICFGISVQSSSGTYQYSLRFNMSQNEERTDGPAPTLPLTLDKGIDLGLYKRTLDYGMIGANTLVHNAILQKETANTNYFTNQVSPVYQETYTQDNIYQDLASNIGIITLLPLLLIYLRQTSIMLTEKETKVRESMYIMGMKGFNYFFSWFARYFIVYLVIHLICSVIITRQLTHIPFGMIIIVFILFDVVLIIQNFFIQVFLSRAKIGIVISLLFFLVQYILSFIAVNSDNPSLSVNRAISIIPHAAFVIAFRTMLYAESYQLTPTFSQEMNYYTIGTAIGSFILNAIFYLILTWYLDQVVPNEWGAKRHPLFCCHSDNAMISEEEKSLRKRVIQSQPGYRENHEEVEEGRLAEEQHGRAIEIVGLQKKFGSGDDEILAVDNLTVSMFQGQIFALLGHNGAGKTTSISMLSGMISPTDGYLSVLGETETHKIREQLGVCPQHDTLYEDLTVEEHLQLFSAFKGLDSELITTEVERLIADVNLQEKREEYSKNLSGGQKRRLSVAIAFAGRSKVIVLDEPTSGMDASARRFVWDLLKSYKNDRVIILTTHFMDEADYLGDRIGIMGEGKLICSGSTVFLKNRFGVGYTLTITKGSPEVDSFKIIDVIRKYVPDAKILTNVATDLALQLPLAHLPAFPGMFNELNQKKSSLKFMEYGISVTTLQQVFLNVGLELEQKKKTTEKLGNTGEFKMSDEEMCSHTVTRSINNKGELQYNESDVNLVDFDRIDREEGECNKFFIHFKATFLKRLRVIRRDLKSFIFQLLLPFFIILFSLFLLRISFIKDFDPQSLTVDTYLTQQNPVLISLGANDTTTYVNTLGNDIALKYGAKVSVQKDTTDAAATTFDQNFLLPKKLAQKTFLGGIFFQQNSNASSTIYTYYTLVNTRSPTSPIFLGSLASQTLINREFSKAITIQTTNAPLPRTNQQMELNNTISGFFASFVFSIALAFKFASIISFIVKEREDRSKHQQIVSGMSITAYWVSNFVYDLILYLLVAVITIGIAKGMNISSITEGRAYAATWMLFIFYGISYISFTYIAAFYFRDYGNAQAAYYFITLVAGGMLPILTFLLRILGEGSNPVGRGLAWVLRLYPSFAFGEGLLNVGSVTLYGIFENNSKPMDPLHIDIALGPIIYLVVGSILFFVLLLLIEKAKNTESLMRYFAGDEAEVEETNPIDESDVQKEAELAIAGDPEDYEILAKRLRKVYMIDGPKKYKVAVDNLSFGIKKGEVFGLLGINGAGKTTTFKILAGEITSTAGDSYFKGMKISDNIDKVREDLGYCPQFDALIENLTVYEQLELFYDLKSLSGQRKEVAINNKLEELDLKKYSDRLSGTLSGGNKRKLSVAMAMIGNPRIVFLDEPSTGMDPKARRFMWKVIARVATQRKDATVILTTHSMEEAEALSSRLGIMVRGNFQCIGSPQYIKHKYGDGLELEIKLKNPKHNDLIELMRSRNLDPIIIKEAQLDNFLEAYKASPEDRLEISQSGAGNYIFFTLRARKEIEVYTLVEFFEVSEMHRRVLGALRSLGDEVEELERLQTFSRVKVRGKPNIGRLFQFFQKNKERLRIQEYTIKQASVEQIFNKFAQIGEQTQYGP